MSFSRSYGKTWFTLDVCRSRLDLENTYVCLRLQGSLWIFHATLEFR
uniref:Uncharacterized protein n=1 Tax=Rhizophora mucronata TaxID=61149 RepID=A0A2P2PTC7_RHIMU